MGIWNIFENLSLKHAVQPCSSAFQEKKMMEKCVVVLGVLHGSWALVFSVLDFTLAGKSDELHLSLLTLQR